MTYANVRFGVVGQALAGAFARKGIEVAVAASRPPKAEAIGPSVTPMTLDDAVKSDVVILAVLFSKVRDVAGGFKTPADNLNEAVALTG